MKYLVTALKRLSSRLMLLRQMVKNGDSSPFSETLLFMMEDIFDLNKSVIALHGLLQQQPEDSLGLSVSGIQAIIEKTTAFLCNQAIHMYDDEHETSHSVLRAVESTSDDKNAFLKLAARFDLQEISDALASSFDQFGEKAERMQKKIAPLAVFAQSSKAGRGKAFVSRFAHVMQDNLNQLWFPCWWCMMMSASKAAKRMLESSDISFQGKNLDEEDGDEDEDSSDVEDFLVGSPVVETTDSDFELTDESDEEDATSDVEIAPEEVAALQEMGDGSPPTKRARHK